METRPQAPPHLHVYGQIIHGVAHLALQRSHGFNNNQRVTMTAESYWKSHNHNLKHFVKDKQGSDVS